jgi:hypothetical protein
VVSGIGGVRSPEVMTHPRPERSWRKTMVGYRAATLKDLLEEPSREGA